MFSNPRKMALASIVSIALGAGGAAFGPSSPASAAHIALSWWELGVTPSYGYGDDYPLPPRSAREFNRAYAPGSRSHGDGEAAVKRQ